VVLLVASESCCWCILELYLVWSQDVENILMIGIVIVHLVDLVGGHGQRAPLGHQYLPY
jgi:hypothetical protein